MHMPCLQSLSSHHCMSLTSAPLGLRGVEEHQQRVFPYRYNTVDFPKNVQLSAGPQLQSAEQIVGSCSQSRGADTSE